MSIANGIREVVSPTEFEVSSDGKVIRIIGIGRAQGMNCSVLPFFALRATMPIERRLEMVFEALGIKLQDLLTRVYGTPWPAADAEPHVTITSDEVKIWVGRIYGIRSGRAARPYSTD
jgi:hypothetical protein